MKRLFCLLLTALLLCAAAPAVGEGEPLTHTQLHSWAEGYMEAALGAKPLNDPAGAGPVKDEGFPFVYDFATLYMSLAEMTADSALRGLRIVSPAEWGPNATHCGQSAKEVLERFENGNPSLAGTRDYAVLYVVDDLPREARWGYVVRSGEDIQTIQYAVLTCLDEDAYSDCGLLYQLEGGEVTEIVAYGLDNVISLSQAQAAVNLVLQQQSQEASFTPPTEPVDGRSLTAFGAEDLSFGSLRMPGTTPDQAEGVLGSFITVWKQEGNDWLMSYYCPSAELVWRCNQKKQQPSLQSVRLMDGTLAGPRGCRVGDSFAAVMERFRYGEGEYDGETELLYGIPGELPFGVAEYAGEGGALLRYACALEDGRMAVLVFHFENMTLTEIELYIASQL